MIRSRFLPLLVVLTVLVCAFCAPSEKVVSDFNLRNTAGKISSLKDFPNAKGFIVVFTCNHCPFAKLYPERLNQLNTKYKPLGVPLIAISSSDTLIHEEDTFAEMVKHSREKKFNFPYLYDNTQAVAREFGAQKTPHAFVIWKEHNSWNVKYNGAIDDNGAEPSKVIHPYVADAVDALLSGKQVLVSETKSIGCSINLKK